jgi:hypothetical protein
MFISKMALPRRTFLRGAGAFVALPFLEAMVPAATALAKTAANPVRRLGCVYIPNGAVMESWTPSSEGSSFQLSQTLKPLEAYRDKLVVVSGLGHPAAESKGDGTGEHARASAVWLNGVRPLKTEGVNVRAATTIDQIVANGIGQDTPLSSLELSLDSSDQVGNCESGYSCAYLNTISWRTPTMPLPMETNPRLVFERLFGEGSSAADRRRELTVDRSILDAVTRDIQRLSGALGATDRVAFSEYLDSVRDVERRIQLVEKQNAVTVSLPTAPEGVPDNFEEHVKLMFDLQALAYQADITRVSTFMVSRETNSRTYPQIGVPDPHHELSHHENKPDKIAKLAKLNNYHVQMLAHFIDKLSQTPDGDGSLLDHSLIMYGGCMSNGQIHSHFPLPLVLIGGAGGAIKGGRHLAYPDRTPMTQLLMGIVDKFGLPTGSFADATGVQDTLPNL